MANIPGPGVALKSDFRPGRASKRSNSFYNDCFCLEYAEAEKTFCKKKAKTPMNGTEVKRNRRRNGIRRKITDIAAAQTKAKRMVIPTNRTGNSLREKPGNLRATLRKKLKEQNLTKRRTVCHLY